MNPEALRLAKLCEDEIRATVKRDILMHETAMELRRLHDENRRLVNTLNHASEVRAHLQSAQQPMTREQIANCSVIAQVFFARNFGGAPAHWTTEQIRLSKEFQDAVEAIVRSVERAHRIGGEE